MGHIQTAMIKALTLSLIFMLSIGCESPLINFQLVRLITKEFKSFGSEKIEKFDKKPLWVATIAGPLSYRSTNNKSGGNASKNLVYGLEHDLLRSFASSYGYDLKFKIFKSESEAMLAMSKGSFDILSIRAGDHLRKSTSFRQAPAFSEQEIILVCHKQAEQKEKKLISGSAWRLSTFEVQRNKALNGSVVSDRSPFYFAKRVLSQKIDCTWLDEQEAGYVFSKHAGKLTKFPLSLKRSYHFYLDNKRSELAMQLNGWHRRAMRSGEMAKIHHRYKGHSDDLNLHDRSRFLQRLSSEFKTFEKEFKTFAGKYQVPWQLVAAVGYQESQWRPEAISHKGATGIMQLMPRTAEFLGVADIKNNTDNISGGAKYLSYLYSRFPKHIAHREKIALALAAYNIGYAHLLDAQAIAVNMGKDPYAWKDIQQILPLLSKPDYYTRVKYGFARGEETVEFVGRVLSYYDLLTTTI